MRYIPMSHQERAVAKISSSFHVHVPGLGWAFAIDTARARFATDATVDEHGVVRWLSNGAVPPSDVLRAFRHAGCDFDYARSEQARQQELDAFLTEYRRTYRGPSAEQRAEARAAHGRGARLVNVVTGHTFTT